MNNIQFIGFPEATLYSKSNAGSKKVKKLLWGDWAKVLDTKGNYIKIHCRNANGWVHKKKLQQNRLLEINFIDVGQGDGCFIVTPKDEFIVIDAGEEDNMYRFLRWRFNLNYNKHVIPIKYLMITHPDKDHYYGFRHIIDSNRFKVQNIYHNGLVERTGSKLLGPKDSGGEYLTDIKDTHQKVKNLVSNKSKRGRKFYPSLLYNALVKQNVNNIAMLGKGDEVPDYGKNDDIQLKILGPVTEKKNNKNVLRYFESDGETKNGHSIIIQLIYNKVKVLLGGDTNNLSEEYLMEHYTGYNPKTVTESKRKVMIKKGKKIFQSDIAKACHHGSHKFIDDFLSLINPIATVISSGDNETHTHPRPDALGAIGKHSRGIRPLIFSTELARSAKEKTEIKEKDIETLSRLYKKRVDASSEEKKKITKQIDKLKYQIQRNIAVYGMIGIRTDGEKVIITQKKEQKSAGFIVYELHQNNNGELEFTPFSH